MLNKRNIEKIEFLKGNSNKSVLKFIKLFFFNRADNRPILFRTTVFKEAKKYETMICNPNHLDAFL